VPGAGRNAPCPCGSGRKFKHCCAGAAPSQSRTAPVPPAVGAALAAAARANAAGDVAQAAAVLQRAAVAMPDSGELALAWGQLLLSLGRAPEAMPWLDRAVARLPTSTHARLAQGDALQALGWPVGALEAFQHAAVLAPRMPEPQARLGAAWLAMDAHDAAASAFRQASALGPRTSIGRLSAAYAHLADGETRAAADALRALVAAEPRNVQAHAELGKLLAELGDRDGAWAAFDTVLRLDPSAFRHYYDLVRIRRLAPADRPLLARMEAAAARAGGRELDRVLLDLAMGRAHDDFDDPARAMRHFQAAGQRAEAVRPLDRDLITRRVDAQMAHFPVGALAGLVEPADGGDDGPTPLLIVGLPRSGTTLVESILARHPAVGAAQELPFWRSVAPAALASGGLPDRQGLDRLASDYRAVLRRHSDRPWVTDKKPDNFFWLGLALAALPRTRIVHCRRHVLDTCVSIVANHFAPRPDFSVEPDALVFYVRAYQRLMAHWRAVLPPDRFLELDYEALVSAPEPEIRRLLGFVGLPWDAACLHPEDGDRQVSTASLWQVRQPISGASVQRWERYRPWLGPLAALCDVGDSTG